MGALKLHTEENYTGLKVVYGGKFLEQKSVQRFLNVDPKAHLMAGWSPYAAMADNPIIMVDPDGAFPYPIHVRSFAPYKTFGGGFHGDNRGWSTGLGTREGGTVTSRMQHVFTVDPDKAMLSNEMKWSDYSSHPIFGTETGKTRARVNDFRATKDADGNSTTTFSSKMAANLPLIPSADIDVTTNFKLVENLKAGTLNVTATQKGDAFPSAETFISDTKGNPLFIGVSPAVGGPYTSLPGDNKRAMMSNSFTITIDKGGVFTGVKQGDKTYSTSDWNNLMQSKPTEKAPEKPYPPR